MSAHLSPVPFFVGSVLLLGMIYLAGCSSQPSRLEQPEIDPNAAQAAISQYDADGDGAIGGAELDKVPAFKSALKRIDKDGDGKVTAEEIDARIAAWRESQIGLITVSALVRQNGTPLPGAEVTLVPEEFQGSAIEPASGTTRQSGKGSLKMGDDPEKDGVRLGFYRIQVSKKDANGTETIPARYNTDTELGVEVAFDDPNVNWVELDLSGR